MRLAVFLISTVVAGAISLQAQTPAAPAARNAPAGNVDNGKKIFASYGCYQCHNYAANGGNAGPRLAPNPIAFPAFIRQIRKPSNEMPPYTAKVVSDQDVADIYAFLQTIPAAPAAGSLAILQP
jgi:ubiquinol-cytochrome c reductase cytochrome c subunit